MNGALDILQKVEGDRSSRVEPATRRAKGLYAQAAALATGIVRNSFSTPSAQHCASRSAAME